MIYYLTFRAATKQTTSKGNYNFRCISVVENNETNLEKKACENSRTIFYNVLFTRCPVHKIQKLQGKAVH
jgi:hypothetical protein